MVRISMQEMDIDRADELMGLLREYAYPDELEKNIHIEAVLKLKLAGYMLKPPVKEKLLAEIDKILNAG